MGYTALYRKFRPLTFSEMVGQEHITRTLKNQIIAGRVGHAYLFNGGRGTGKTSSAKILARAINCLNPQDGEPCNECEMCRAALNGSLTDIVEMDAASNNSVEDIRSIREEVNFLPTKAKYRVYIIDEVHMLSPGAFNALLKTLEEPPEHVKFILATTEPQRLPATILSRCQRFDFKKIGNDDIVKRLEIVVKESNIEITKEALNMIAVLSEGAMRDALSVLERCIQDGDSKIDEDKIKDLVGIPKTIYVHNIVKAIVEYNVDEALENVDKVLNDGKDITNLLWEIIKYSKDVLVYKVTKKIELYSNEEQEKIKELSEKVSKEKLMEMIYELSELENNMKWSTQKTIIFQAGIIKLCTKKVEQQNVILQNVVQEAPQRAQNIVQEKPDKVQNNANTTVNAMNAINNAGNSISNVGNTTGNNSNANRVVSNLNIGVNAKASTQKFSNKSEEYWPQIVSNLKQNGKIVLYTNLINTQAKPINDMTVGIEFSKVITPFGKAVLEKPENIKEISTLVSMACGKEMQIKYIEPQQVTQKTTIEDNLKNLANESEIPFNIIDE